MTRRWASPVGFPTPPSLQKIKSVLATALLLMNSLKSIEAEIPWHWSKVTDTNCWRELEDATCNKNGIMWKYFEHFLHYLFPERIVKCVDQLKVELLESHTVEQKLHSVCLHKELISDHKNLIGNYILIMFYIWDSFAHAHSCNRPLKKMGWPSYSCHWSWAMSINKI